MPAVSPREIVNALLQAIGDSGYSGVYLNQRVREHPRRFAIALSESESISAWIYIWTLTHGGRPSLANEYRIQMTSVESPLSVNPNGPTVLLGYEPDQGMFAGFDLSRHRVFTTGSPSVQINIQAIRDAITQGLSFSRKTNDEIAIGIRSDQLVDYILNAPDLHKYGKFADTLGLLNRITAFETISDQDIAPLSEPRKRVVETVSRLTRNGNFRKQIMQAYENRCAVTRVQLKLVDAAHILPVGAPESTDDVRNGLALAPTYHRAYDAGLIFLNEQFEMKINPSKVAELRRLDLIAGLNTFQSHLGRIHLPPDQKQWPIVTNIQKANRFRQIS
jgi:putative restriction endonuclease